MADFEPELGQAVFGAPWQAVAMPEYIEAMLNMISAEMERVEWNRTQQTFDSPMSNSGSQYETAVFKARAYYWGEDESLAALPNFEWRDVKISWYKYCGRGSSMSREVPPAEAAQMLDECLASIRARDVA